MDNKEAETLKEIIETTNKVNETLLKTQQQIRYSILLIHITLFCFMGAMFFGLW